MQTPRALLVVTAVAALSLSAACDKKTDNEKASVGAEGGASGELQASGSAVASAPARGGGQLVTAGSYVVEIRLFKSGHAEGFVYDAKGAPIADEHAKVTLHANASRNAHPSIELGFFAPMGRLSGDAAGNAELTPGPVWLELALGGATVKGELDAPVLLVGPEMGGTLVVAGKYGVELVARVDGTVEAIVHDAAGVRIGGDAGLKLEAKLQRIDGQAHAVALAFDAASGRFVGHADASVKLAAGLADVSINGEMVARLPRLALRAEASHRGRMIVAGDYSVELVAKGSAITAFAFDASGAASAKADLDLALRLGAGAFVKLVWDGPSASYRAQLAAAADLDAQPITLALKADGKAFVGASLPNVALDANAEVGAHAKLDAKGALGAKANVKAPSAAATVKVQAPKIKASAGTAGGAGAGGAATAKAGFSFGTK